VLDLFRLSEGSLYLYIYIYKFLFSETPALGTDLEKTLKAKEPDFEIPGTSRFFDSLSFSKKYPDPAGSLIL